MLNAVLSSLDPDYIAKGGRTFFMVRSPIAEDLYFEIIPGKKEIGIHFASEAPKFDQHMMATAQATDPDFCDKIKAFDKLSEEWRNAWH